MYHLKHSFELKIQLLTSVTTSKVLPASADIAFQCLLIIKYVRPDRKPRMRRLRYCRTPCVGSSILGRPISQQEGR